MVEFLRCQHRRKALFKKLQGVRGRKREKKEKRFVSTTTEELFRKPINLCLGHTVLETLWLSGCWPS